jgi:deazaflavin-dependent oxidoreductase (nitroreductase family)
MAGEVDGQVPAAADATRKSRLMMSTVVQVLCVPHDPTLPRFVALGDPNVDVQVKGDRFRATARVAGPDEKPEMWAKMIEVWPAYDDDQKKSSREISVVVPHRAESG